MKNKLLNTHILNTQLLNTHVANVAIIKRKGKEIILRHQNAMSNPFSSEMDIGFDYMSRRDHIQFLLFDGYGEGMYKHMSRLEIRKEARKIEKEGEQEIFRVYDSGDREDAGSIGYLAVDKTEGNRDTVRDYLHRYLAYKNNETYSLNIGAKRYNWLIDTDIKKIVGRFSAWRLFRQL